MPCDTVRRRNQTKAQRAIETKAALKRLEAALKAKRVKVEIGANGAVAFAGWAATDRDDVSDVCAYRSLLSSGSWALSQAVAEAEARCGRKVSAQAVGAGVHSHDGGKSWHPGH